MNIDFCAIIRQEAEMEEIEVIKEGNNDSVSNSKLKFVILLTI